MTPLQRARRSLEGLSTGDAFGQLFFSISPDTASIGALPAGPWPWTDDTHMALSIVEVLTEHQRINQDALAAAFVRRYMDDPFRGYAGGAAQLLKRLASGADWRVESPVLFDGGFTATVPRCARRQSARTSRTTPSERPTRLNILRSSRMRIPRGRLEPLPSP